MVAYKSVHKNANIWPDFFQFVLSYCALNFEVYLIRCDYSNIVYTSCLTLQNNHISFCVFKIQYQRIYCTYAEIMNIIFYALQPNDKTLIKCIIRSIHYNIYMTKSTKLIVLLVGPLRFRFKQFSLHIHFCHFSGNIFALFLQNVGTHFFTILSLRLFLQFSQYMSNMCLLC